MGGLLVVCASLVSTFLVKEHKTCVLRVGGWRVHVRGPLTSLKSCKNIGPGENLGRGHKNEIILGYPLCWPKK